jgi:glutamate-1-semialdehyde 2,1-aminomutase
MDDSRPNSDLGLAVVEAEARYRAANPASERAYDQALAAFPGGDTRTVLFYSPFPLTWASGEGATLRDLDGHAYTDFLGEYTAALYGHSHPVIQQAIMDALKDGIVLGGPNRYQGLLAAEISRRFPSLEQLRFCNSGTEANLLALSTARAITGRASILVFEGAYHGSLLYFGRHEPPINAPLPVVKAPYNDIEGTLQRIEQHADCLAAVIIEPMQGSGSCIPADREFLAALREACDRHGIVLIFDEVMTSRLSPGGCQTLLGITPDMTTLGKYLGGGLSFGAFGGRRRLMERFDPRREDSIPHGGTFNNNVLSMAAGWAGISKVLSAEAIGAVNARGDRLRHKLNATAAARAMPVRATGVGSLIGLHFTRGDVRRPSDLVVNDAAMARRNELQKLMHFDLIEHGQYMARRGFISLSLPLTDAECDAFVAAFDEFLAVRGSLVESAVPR